MSNPSGPPDPTADSTAEPNTEASAEPPTVVSKVPTFEPVGEPPTVVSSAVPEPVKEPAPEPAPEPATAEPGAQPTLDMHAVTPQAAQKAVQPPPGHTEGYAEPTLEMPALTHRPAGASHPSAEASDDSAAPTTVIATPKAAATDPDDTGERRYTAPSSYDFGPTIRIELPPEPPTEVLTSAAATQPHLPQAPPHVPQGPPGVGHHPPQAPPPPHQAPGPHPALGALPPGAPQRTATPQAIPAGQGREKSRRRSWVWVLAVVLAIAALAAVAIFGTIWLTKKNAPTVSQEDLVKQTIQNFDIAIQKGDLATLRSITCGTSRDTYVKYDDASWAEIHSRVAAAKRYPVIASIDQVAVNGESAEANVTTFMAYDPQIRSTRSFDLQFRDGQWKICQQAAG